MSASLLPSNSTPWEVAESLTSAARRPLPADLIKSVWNPWTCPLDLLPYLAWGLGLEIWKDEWPEQKKREIVSRIWLLKRQKTTLQGIRNYLNLVDADIVKAVRPRDMVFCVDPFTQEEQAAIDAALPQIKIYPHARNFPVGAGHAFWDECALDATCATTPDDAADRFAERAIFIDDGVETPCEVRGLNGAVDASYTVQLATGGNVAMAFADAWVVDRDALFPDDAPSKIIAIRPDPSALSFAVPAGLAPTTVRPIGQADVVQAGPAMAFDFFILGRGVLYPDDAADHLYSVLRFYDPSKAPTAKGRAISFWDWSSFGCAPYTARLTLDVRLQGVPWGLPGPLDLGVVFDPDMSPYWDAADAVRVAQALRDDIFISTRTEEPVEFISGLKFGEFDFGDYRRIS